MMGGGGGLEMLKVLLGSDLNIKITGHVLMMAVAANRRSPEIVE